MGRDKEDDKQPLDYADPAAFPGKYRRPGHLLRGLRLPGTLLRRALVPADGRGNGLPTDEDAFVKGVDVRRTPAMKYRELYRAADMPATLSDIPGPRLADARRTAVRSSAAARRRRGLCLQSRLLRLLWPVSEKPSGMVRQRL